MFILSPGKGNEFALKNLVIVGTGPFAEVSSAYFGEFGHRNVVAHAANLGDGIPRELNGLPVIEIRNLTDIFPPNEVEVFVAIGHKNMNQVRANIVRSIASQGFQLASFIHPEVKIWDSTILGRHLFVFESNVIQPFTRIGSNSILWSGNHIGHHTVVGEDCFISSHVVISGMVDVGRGSFLGVNSTVADGIALGERSFLRPGAIATRDVPAGSVVSGARSKISQVTSLELSKEE